MKILAVVGARPNFIKIAPLAWEVDRRRDMELFLVHTGQHYDKQLSDVFFKDLQIPHPNVNLGVGSGSHAVQTAEVMKGLEPVLLKEKPDVVLVPGDVNSTIASALTAVKLGIPVAHVESGLRSFDFTMPEEINRRLTDQISRWLFVTEESGVDNLLREGIPQDRVHLVGNVMIDTLFRCRDRIDASPILEQLELKRGGYALLTLHRPSNVDDAQMLSGLIDAISTIGQTIPVIFPVHPRTRNVLNGAGAEGAGIRFIEPLGYLDFLKLQANAGLVLTDSGGVQEETTALGVPCLTLRDNTERPTTVEEGTNTLVGRDPGRIIAAAREILGGGGKPLRKPELWDGHAAERIMDVLTAEWN
jgi:UDP-N-acetylglucosamine 2-epimerase (non-hydrolysing)